MLIVHFTSILITSAPPQIIRHWLPEADDIYICFFSPWFTYIELCPCSTAGLATNNDEEEDNNDNNDDITHHLVTEPQHTSGLSLSCSGQFYAGSASPCRQNATWSLNGPYDFLFSAPICLCSSETGITGWLNPPEVTLCSSLWRCSVPCSGSRKSWRNWALLGHSSSFSNTHLSCGFLTCLSQVLLSGDKTKTTSPRGGPRKETLSGILSLDYSRLTTSCHEDSLQMEGQHWLTLSYRGNGWL